MSVWFVTGVLGGGKTLVSVSRAIPYLEKGRPVATNLDLFFDRFPENYTTSKPYCLRLPDHPSSNDLKALGYGNTSANEEKNGLLIFDECGTWFNSHGWNAPDRKEFIDVLIHIRKYGWDVMFLVQDFEMVDKQCRQAICEYLVTCRRTDKINIPVVSALTKALTGQPFPLPRMHIGTVMYGRTQKAIKADVWRYRGTELFDFYNTKQVFESNYPHGTYCYLKPSNFHYDKSTRAIAKADYRRRSFRRLWHIRPPVLFFFILGFAGALMFSALFSWFGSATDKNADEIEQRNNPTNGAESDPVQAAFLSSADSVRLTGVAEFGQRRFYFFSRDGEPYDPEVDGFAYLPFGDCGAWLVKDDYKRAMTCSHVESES